MREQIVRLRQQMQQHGIDVYVIPTADFHQSEYVGEHFKARKYVTGFTGSAGTAVVTADEARLWTDGRYFIQAANQLEGSGVELMKMGESGVAKLTEYLADILAEGKTLGFDGRVVSKSEGESYAKIAAERKAKVVYDLDLVDEIWEDRPALSAEPVFELGLEYAGESAASKIARVREEMRKAGATIHVLTTLDDICWLLNIRGNDIEFLPMVLAYAVVTMEDVRLYIDESKLDDAVKTSLASAGVNFHPYNDIYEDVKGFTAEETLLIDPKRLNYALYNNLPSAVRRVEKENPEILFKARKNEVEVENIRRAQLKDSVAHIRFMKWLKENIGKTTITEMSAVEKLDGFRAELGNFIRPSFDAISSFGEHAAIVHYSATPETDVELKMGGLFLTDTGAGFMEGSTDITRTYALGEIPAVMKEHFTLVAISHLSLADAKFLKGCTGLNLDILARKPFWDRNLNFNHGTGHGVGYLLNIHEGPAGFRWQFRAGETHPLEKGMVLTNEPGMYIAGSHGVRLENEVLVCEGEKNEYGEFMYLEQLTYIPFDLDAIDAEMMTETEKKLLNSYHAAVYEKTAPFLTDEEKAWLKHYTRAV
ncbi:MAG: aminopeptidase P family protein [Oscillospiraceae bacterium]|nr:aminopeptidase P family protein [Oscillospiraceae bacterium]